MKQTCSRYDSFALMVMTCEYFDETKFVEFVDVGGGRHTESYIDERISEMFLQYLPQQILHSYRRLHFDVVVARLQFCVAR